MNIMYPGLCPTEKQLQAATAGANIDANGTIREFWWAADHLFSPAALFVSFLFWLSPAVYLCLMIKVLRISNRLCKW